MNTLLIGSRGSGRLVGCVLSVPLVAAAGFVVSTLAAGCRSGAKDDQVRPSVIADPIGEPGARRSGEWMETVERGRYLVAVGVCNDCHTPFKMGANGPEPDMTRMLSGHPAGLQLPKPPTPTDEHWIVSISATNTAFAGPWGVTYAANLTPDVMTGIGIWTEDMFIGALREGKHMGTSRPIMPPMPWPWYGQMTDEDLKAVFAYLQSIPPITNQVPTYYAPGEQPSNDYEGEE